MSENECCAEYSETPVARSALRVLANGFTDCNTRITALQKIVGVGDEYSNTLEYERTILDELADTRNELKKIRSMLSTIIEHLHIARS